MKLSELYSVREELSKLDKIERHIEYIQENLNVYDEYLTINELIKKLEADRDSIVQKLNNMCYE